MKALKWIGISMLAFTGVQADFVWNDRFDEEVWSTVWYETCDASLSEHWNLSTAGSGASVTQTGGQLVMDTGGTGVNREAALNTATDETGTVSTFNGAKLYNIYEYPVTARFDIDSISGESNGSSGRNAFYFSIGDDADGCYMPKTGFLDDGIGFVLEQLDSGSGPYWRIMYYSLINAASSGGTVATLSGLPTALTYTLDGTQAVVQMEGATISAVGNQGSGTPGGTELGVSLADLSANITGYNLAFGSFNNGNVSEKTVVVLDAFSAEPYYSVVNYGAIPDDGLDDNSAIQAALNAANQAAGFNTVYVPAGDYIASQLRIGSNTRLLGAGSDGEPVSRIIREGGNNDLLRNIDRDNGNSNIILSRLWFDGNKDTQTQVHAHTVNMWNVTGLLVDQCHFQNAKSSGLVVQGNKTEDYETEILNCTSSGNGQDALYIQSRDGVINAVNGIIISNWVSIADAHASDIYLSSNVYYIACRAAYNTHPDYGAFSSDNCTDLHYIDCIAEDNAGSGFIISINTNDLVQPSGITFLNCTARFNGKLGFVVANARDVVLSNCQIYGNGAEGIEALSHFKDYRQVVGLIVEHSDIYSNATHGITLRGVSNSVIRDCLIINNSVQKENISHGICIVKGKIPGVESSHILIEHNLIYNESTSGQCYGVYSAHDTDYISLLYNDLTPNQTGPYFLVGENNTVEGNQ